MWAWARILPNKFLMRKNGLIVRMKSLGLTSPTFALTDLRLTHGEDGKLSARNFRGELGCVPVAKATGAEFGISSDGWFVTGRIDGARGCRCVSRSIMACTLRVSVSVSCRKRATSTKGGMAAVLNLEPAVLAEVCKEADVEMANLNCPGQIGDFR